MLFHVYDDPKPEGYFINEPFGIYRSLLDADWLMYLLLPLLLGVIVYGMMVAWRMHELPKHKAEQKKMRQVELVSALTLLGLFQHWVWSIALFVAYMDWEVLEETVVRILRRARQPEPETPVAQTAEVVMAEPCVPQSPLPAANQVTEEPRA